MDPEAQTRTISLALSPRAAWIFISYLGVLEVVFSVYNAFFSAHEFKEEDTAGFA